MNYMNAMITENGAKGYYFANHFYPATNFTNHHEKLLKIRENS